MNNKSDGLVKRGDLADKITPAYFVHIPNGLTASCSAARK
jgi:hypothetical protein